MIIFLLELLLIVIAPLTFIALSVLRLAGRIRMSMVAITLICLLAGVALPILASYLDIVNLPSDVKCATGSVGFAMLGICFTLVVIPVAGIVFSIIAYSGRKKLNVTTKCCISVNRFKEILICLI